MLKGKNVLVGVTGGIAAYKALDVVSKLKKLNANVDVIMTENATKFVCPLSFSALTNGEVAVDTFDEIKDNEIKHISLAKKADVFLIVPATANVIAKIANGIADDMLTSTLLAFNKKTIIAPAMNTVMYENIATKSNIKLLLARGFLFVEPQTGQLACGDIGSGKLADVENIIDFVVDVLRAKQDLLGKKVLITAGATREKLDPVRYLTNPSTGKMGYYLARILTERGAEVVLISGITHIEKENVSKFISVGSASEMNQAVMDNVKDCDIAIFSAAVADYRPEFCRENKIKKTGDDLVVNFVRNPDIAKSVNELGLDIIKVGFAAETENVVQNAREKLNKKGFNFVVANNILSAGAGFGSETNIVSIIDKDTVTNYEIMSKVKLASVIADKIVEIYER